MTPTAAQILDQHTRLADKHRHPSPELSRYLAYHMRDITRHVRDRTGGKEWMAVSMFWPVVTEPRTVITTAHGDRLAMLIGRGLASAVTFQVTREMTTVMRQVYDSSPDRIEHIDAHEVPCPAGFAWLDDPWLIRGDFTVRAVSWEYTEDTVSDAGHGSPCARIGLWVHDDDRPDGAWSAIGSLTLTHTVLMPLGLRFGMNDQDDLSSRSFLGLVHLLWIYLGMEIVDQQRPQVERAFRRRAQRVLTRPDVRVMVLRKVRHATDPSGSHRQVNWSCTWLVQGHWRHGLRPHEPHHALPAGPGKHCAVCGRELHWVRPYLKGPDGGPLKVTEQTVYKLAR